MRLVTAADGRAWRVRRHWLPRAARRAKRQRAVPDEGIKWLDGLDPAGGVAARGPRGWIVALLSALIVEVIVLTVLVADALPFLVVAINGAIVAVVAAVGTALGVLVRRPWLVSARSADRERSWAVVGWRRSHLAIDAVADSLASGNAIDAVDPRRALGAPKS